MRAIEKMHSLFYTKQLELDSEFIQFPKDHFLKDVQKGLNYKESSLLHLTIQITQYLVKKLGARQRGFKGLNEALD